MWIDARIPVVFGALDEVRAVDAVIVEGDAIPAGMFGLSFQPGPGVPSAGCPCCASRGPLATVVGNMFAARARGEAPFFERVVAVLATPAGRQTIRAVLTADPVCAARFRLSGR
ncbi:MAG TPA: hypothetical protein VHS58_13000 [Acetobacteraceae bacterium]|jgi:hypothetical protein|nr:hypothetical protein [Acetobacteraceae bacterium]